MTKKNKDFLKSVREGLKQAKAGQFVESPMLPSPYQEGLPPTLKRAYKAWLSTLSEELREHVKTRIIDSTKVAFIAGWSACCEAMSDEPLVEAQELLASQRGDGYHCTCLHRTKRVPVSGCPIHDEDHPSKLHGSDPNHVCGIFCDGADSPYHSQCAQEKAMRLCVNCEKPENIHSHLGDTDHWCEKFLADKRKTKKRARGRKS